MTLFLNVTHPSFNMPQGGAREGGRNILNIFKLFPEWLPKKKQPLGGLAENTNIVSQKRNRPDES